MNTLTTALLLLAALVNLIFLFLVYNRSRKPDGDPMEPVHNELRLAREEQRGGARELREEVSRQILTMDGSLARTLTTHGQSQQSHQGSMVSLMRELAEAGRVSGDSLRSMLDSRIRDLHESNEGRLGAIRGEIGSGLKSSADAMTGTLEQMSTAQRSLLVELTGQVKSLSESNQTTLDRIRSTLDARVREMQETNERKLDEMRRTVDEKLHDTLEKRLGESFKLVSDRLESVHKGLGEMQTLASGVGDLKRVLTNVKTRGTWAEVQLGAILDQVLTADQFARNVCVREGSAERVEYAIRLPGPKDNPKQCVWLPLDSKFPHEDYARLQTAAESGDPEAVQSATEALLRAVRLAASEIHDKYVNPPETTDFAIMFLATEGLYAEVLRQPAFVEELQQKYRTVIAGPTTVSAILNSLRMGFQTLAVEQRAAEVWQVLGGVKSEFGKFGTWLDKVQRQLQTATKTLEETGTRTRAMERRLRSVEQLGPSDTAMILKLPSAAELDVTEATNDPAASEASGVIS